MSTITDEYDNAQLLRLMAFYNQQQRISTTAVAATISEPTNEPTPTPRAVVTNIITPAIPVATSVSSINTPPTAAVTLVTVTPLVTMVSSSSSSSSSSVAVPVVPSVILYVHPSSTCSRAVLLLVYQHRIPLHIKVLDLQHGEHQSSWYTSINPNQCVPALVDGDFVLTESSSIMKYLCDKHMLSSVYPIGARARARVDQLMDWIAHDLYKPLINQLVLPQVLRHHTRTDAIHQDAVLIWARNKTVELLRVLDQYYIGDNQWIAGNQCTIVDYMAAAVFATADMISPDWTAYHNITRWFKHVRTLPTFAATDSVRAAWSLSLRGVTYITITSADYSAPLSYDGFAVLPPIHTIREHDAKICEYYYHPAATSARSVSLFVADHPLMTTSITATLVDLMDTAQMKPQYMVINPNHAVPSYREVDDNGDIFLLTQSSAILKYLAHKFESPYYPKDLRTRARINMMMDWLLTNFQLEYCFHFLYPQIFPQAKREPVAVNDAIVERGRIHCLPMLRLLNDYYIGSNKYLCGSSISIADYIGISLITVGELGRIDWYAASLTNIASWIITMKSVTSWNTANAMHMALIPMFKQLPMVPINGGIAIM